MRLSEIETQLSAIFASRPQRGRKRHIVFWYDDQAEFVDDVPRLDLGDVRLLTLTGNNNYEINRTLEVDDANSDFLVYSPRPRPVPESNWLLDIELYSEHFTADRLDIIMRELGMDRRELRGTLEKYRRFFNSKERIEKFRALGIAEYSERSIEIGIMSVLTKQKVADVNGVFRVLLCADDIDDITGMVGAEIVHKYACSEYGYSSSEFELETFRLMAFVSAFAHQAQMELPRSWRELISSRKASCYILVDGLSRQPESVDVYNRMAGWVADSINLSRYIDNWDPWAYASSGVFQEFDIAIITRIIDGLVEQVDTFEYWLELMEKRRTTRWYSLFEDIYKALEQAITVVQLRQAWGSGFAKGDAEVLFRDYTQRYYLMDQAYRKFYLAYDKVKNPELLKGVRDRVEGIYANWFLQELGMAWSDRLEEELSQWQRLDSAVDQQSMFFQGIKHHLERDGRVFVIISDALRYEVGKELAKRLQSEFSGETEMRAMQGVLPSITSLGMAALLPHESLTIGSGGDGLIDGQSTAGLQGREMLLARAGYASKAMQAKDILAMTTDEMRSVLDGIRLVYIYQDRIDDTGHHKNESDVFTAAEDAMDEIVDVVRALRNKISATNIYITADHGFIYTRDVLGESDKLEALTASLLYMDRRCGLARYPVSDSGVVSIKLPHKSADGDDLYLIAPRSYIRFKKHGPGLNYGHGGPSLQEIVIPKIWHRNDKAGKHTVAKVNLELRASAHRITNRVFTLEFLQEHPVGVEWLPRNVIAKFVDADGRPVSDQVVMIADRTSQDRNDRLFRERFTLSGTQFDKDADYYLVLEDPDERVEKVIYKRRFQIDLTIAFGFDF
jgi:uncharacterized protein (TIGR02687 family)